ncbi:MAG TPA: HAD family hydrolase [Candidatus Thermoplasmatota archaeon]|nr:HAD family hydrolase [Candidatus Thermoplasmatota archaeon]
MKNSLKKPILSFDLDGTLMKPGFGDKVWLEGLPNIYAITHNISSEEAKNQLITAYDAIGNERREWYDLTYWIHKLNLDIAPNDLLNTFSKYIQPYPEVPDIIKRLYKNYTLIVSSAAMKPFIFIELKTARLSDYFTELFSATSDTQTVKKDPFFYQMISQKMNRDPKEIIHVGDNKQFDYISPKKAGLHAIYLDRTNDETGDQSINSLTKFEDYVQRYPFK